MYAVFAEIVINRASMPYIFVDKLLKEKNAKKHLFTAFPLKAKMIFIHRRGKVHFFD